MATQRAIPSFSPSHLHVAGLQCPVCDQPISNDKADQVRERMEARERAASDAVSARLREQFVSERAQFEASARVTLERVRTEGAATLEAFKVEAAVRERAAREEAAAAARETAQHQIDLLAKANADLQASIDRRIEEMKQGHELALSVAHARVTDAERAKADVEAAAQDRIQAAEVAKKTAELEAKATKEIHETVLNERLQEQREAYERDKEAALRAEQVKTFDERQKLQSTVQALQRQLEKERADVIGEGGELELAEVLKSAFEGDRIRRVPKGIAGADIIHEVIENGKVCGKIVYDSKKRAAWKAEYATKLCQDKIAEGAQHAVLSLLKFPSDAKQLDIREGVILANPARVKAVAEILREHIVQSHTLRLSNEEREKKQGELYSYIVSGRFAQHLDTIDAHAQKLLDLDVAEERAHRKVWENRGALLKNLQKAEGSLRTDVGKIIGQVD
ncbi:DUF2130 domain-containing protein [Bradyrhizobium elkanii]|uniref:DUF2130 domain-containing protein n=1 Tax=Bradyrhizobium elkanii TaxID=29448 RepID=UPI00272CC8AB|nr:DUF2130 domain-containing protein [Bradyrhizobium elkanii]WLA81951.1 DUF2130 domain-containing protein [Bradyrhizobium elkanii]